MMKVSENATELNGTFTKENPSKLLVLWKIFSFGTRFICPFLLWTEL